MGVLTTAATIFYYKNRCRFKNLALIEQSQVFPFVPIVERFIQESNDEKDRSVSDIPDKQFYLKDHEGKNLNGLKLVKQNIQDCSFNNANLCDVDFSVSILNNIDLSGADISGADFSGAILFGVKYVGIKVSDTTIIDSNKNGLLKAPPGLIKLVRAAQYTQRYLALLALKKLAQALQKRGIQNSGTFVADKQNDGGAARIIASFI